MLILDIYRQIRKIAAIGKISDSTRYADEPPSIAGRHDDISVT